MVLKFQLLALKKTTLYPFRYRLKLLRLHFWRLTPFSFFYIEKHQDVLSVGPIHYAQDPQTSFFTQTFIKNGSHDTIYTFKNYFTTVLLVFSFQQNKRYLNTPFYNSPYINAFIFQNTAKYYSFIYYSLSLSLSLFNPQPHDLSSPVSLSSSSSSLQPTATKPTTQCTI